MIMYATLIKLVPNPKSENFADSLLIWLLFSYRGARRLVRPLLAGLMETDSSRMWSFDNFLDIAKQIVSHEVVCVFSLCNCEILHVFLRPDDR